MKKVIVAAALAALLAPAARAADVFWFGPKITDTIDPATAADLEAVLNRAAGQINAKQFSWANEHQYAPGVSVWDPERAWNGYTLLTVLAALGQDGVNGAVLVDMNGNVVRSWPVVGFPAKMLPGGDVIGGYRGTVNVGPTMDTLVQLDWCGNEVWRWSGRTDRADALQGGARWHHDFQREGSSVGYWSPYHWPIPSQGAKTLVLTSNEPSLDDTRHISSHPLFDDAFFELDWDGNVVFEWYVWQHFGELGFDETAREAIRTKFVPGGFQNRTDWTHVNTADWVGPNKWYYTADCRFDPEFIMWDSRSMNIGAIVATHDCEPGCLTPCKKGDVVWKIGPDYTHPNPEAGLGQIIGPHNMHMIPEGLPGEGNILLFDNGGFAGFGALMKGLSPTWPATFRNYSRVIEFDPVQMKVVWEYSVKDPAPGEKPFFSVLISNAQRLPNGNTLITEGGSGRIFEVTVDGEIVWEFVSPFKGPVTGGGGFIGPNGVYRAYRVPEEWLPPEHYRQACPNPGGPLD